VHVCYGKEFGRNRQTVDELRLKISGHLSKRKASGHSPERLPSLAGIQPRRVVTGR
jgi:hypothetical protein